MELTTTKNGNFLSPFWSDLLPDGSFFGHRRPLMESVLSSPPANVIENGSSYKVELAVPGFSKKDFNIDVQDSVLSINAEKEAEKNEKEKQYTRKEFMYASFSRSFTLPQNCDDTKIKAEYTHGILTLEIPKKESKDETPKKAIEVK